MSDKGFQLLDMDDESAGILAYSIGDGKITEEDAAPIWDRFDAAKANGAKVRVYAEMSAMPSVAGAVILDKLKHLGSIITSLERVAVVGDAGWLAIYAKLVDPITKPDIRHFTMEQKNEAAKWIRN